MVPVKTFGDYVVAFEAEDEHMTARHHFIKECGCTEREFRKIRDFPFFCAHVSIYKDGESLADEYLGCCSYERSEQFYKEMANGYFSDMVLACAEEIGDASLIGTVGHWISELRLQANTERTQPTLFTSARDTQPDYSDELQTIAKRMHASADTLQGKTEFSSVLRACADDLQQMAATLNGED